MIFSGIFLMLLLDVRFLKSSTIPKLKSSTISPAIPAPICEHKNYCEIAPYYPTDIVVDVIKKNPHLHHYATKDGEADIFPQDEKESEEEMLCVSTEQIIFPKIGMTRSSEWKYIMNHKTFSQSVRIETCVEEDKPCRVIEGFAEGYYTKCKQKYIYHQLLTINADGSVSRDAFRFPASCCCHVQFQADKFLLSFNSSQ